VRGILLVWCGARKAIRSLRCRPEEDPTDFAILELENNAPVDRPGHEASAPPAILPIQFLLAGFPDFLLRQQKEPRRRRVRAVTGK